MPIELTAEEVRVLVAAYECLIAAKAYKATDTEDNLARVVDAELDLVRLSHTLDPIAASDRAQILRASWGGP